MPPDLGMAGQWTAEEGKEKQAGPGLQSTARGSQNSFEKTVMVIQELSCDEATPCPSSVDSNHVRDVSTFTSSMRTSSNA